jgi:hypothetical protein
VLGVCSDGGNPLYWSYGDNLFQSQILGHPVTLSRLAMNVNIITNPAGSLWANAASIGRVEVYYIAPGPGPCYANCDGSTTAPILNVEDFSCFINRFAQGCR